MLRAVHNDMQTNNGVAMWIITTRLKCQGVFLIDLLNVKLLSDPIQSDKTSSLACLGVSRAHIDFLLKAVVTRSTRMTDSVP